MIHVGDCLEVMRTMQENSFDSIVTDPPYGLGFMGKKWDHGVPGVPFWAEALRVAKPGAYLAAFGGTRTFHRLACAIEDAGWELRDSILRMHDMDAAIADCPWLAGWVYGSGFPKSHNGQWGGTALKPAWEPVILARKPIKGTVAATFAEYGTGGLNIDGCRVAAEPRAPVTGRGAIPARNNSGDRRDSGAVAQPHELGRWPANVIHDGSDDVLAAFPETPGQQGDLVGHSKDRRSKHAYGDMRAARDAIARTDSGSAARFFYCAKASRADRNDGCEGMPERPSLKIDPTSAMARDGNRGSGMASNHHPTVKPTDLMRWLCRLVTPAGGLILDPFAGSGSTGRGALLEGFRFTGIELDPEYAAIAEARIRAVQPGLPFGDAA